MLLLSEKSSVNPHWDLLALNESTWKPGKYPLLAFGRNCPAAHVLRRAAVYMEASALQGSILQVGTIFFTFRAAQETSCLRDVFWRRGHPPWCPAALARAHSGNSRRIQLPADGGHLCSRPAGQPHTPHVDEFRNFPCELASYLFLDVSSGPRSRSGHWPIAWESMDRCAPQRRRDVRRNSVDAAGMDAGALGAIGRRFHGAQPGN